MKRSRSEKEKKELSDFMVKIIESFDGKDLESIIFAMCYATATVMRSFAIKKDNIDDFFNDFKAGTLQFYNDIKIEMKEDNENTLH